MFQYFVKEHHNFILFYTEFKIAKLYIIDLSMYMKVYKIKSNAGNLNQGYIQRMGQLDLNNLYLYHLKTFFFFTLILY